MDVTGLYQEIILDHFREKHHSGLLDYYDVEVTHVNPSCGDELTLQLKLNDDEIFSIGYEGEGCSISQASTSVMCDLVIGLTGQEAMSLYNDFLEMMESQGQGTPDENRLGDAVAFHGVSQFPGRVKCAMLAWSALRDALYQTLGQEN